MLKFLATTENIRKIGSEDSNYNCRKVVKNSSDSNESRAVLFVTVDRK